MLSSDELNELASLLRPQPINTNISAERQHELLLRGVLAALEDAAADTPASVDTLRATAVEHLDVNVRSQALQALLRLAENHSPAIDALYSLAVEGNLLAARQAILTHDWQPQRPTLRALFDWFTCFNEDKSYPENALPQLTEAYFSDASPVLQRRLLATANQNQAENWASIVTAVQSGTTQAHDQLIHRYPSFRPVERQVAITKLAELASQGSSEAREAIARLFILHEDPQAREILLSNRFLPDDPEQRALLFFLTGDWERYHSLDFDHNLLVSAYERAGRTLRRRLLEHSRYNGQTGWLRSLEVSAAGSADGRDVRWIADLSDADWDLTIHRLSDAGRLVELWRLAQVAPPIWSAAILASLGKKGWQPEETIEHEGFTNLAILAVRCLESPFNIRSNKSLQAPITDITSLAIHPAGRLLAAGSSEQRVILWELPDGDLRDPAIMGPTPMTRALAFSPDGELIACAGGDNRIRLFRVQTGQLVKTLEGHRAMIRGLAIHPDGRTLYSAGFDGAVRFWRFPHGDLLKTLRPGPGEVFSIALGARGSHLLSAGADNLIHVWSLPEAMLARTLIGHSNSITLLAASPTSELAASAGRDGMLRLWNFTSGGILRTIPVSEPLTALCMHPNEQVLISGSSSGEITLWNLSTGRVLERLTEHRKPVTGLVLSPGGERLYSADSTAAILAWDLQTYFEMRLAGESTRPGAVQTYQERLKKSGLSPAEKKWLEFSAALAAWRQRFDIELVDPGTIMVGEFDIELA